jgi:hypothetical protein
MNLLTIIIFFDYYLTILGNINKWIVISPIVVLVWSLNYFALYKGGYYKFVFDKFENDTLLNFKKINLIVGIYLFLSLIAVIGAAHLVSLNYLPR